ncbi:MAG: SDR family NAD(P)-dependent oxidoreductase [Phycisphaerae bacterium]|nr:SDR family NAD(P)-dependent oxidoreductase [Phycisphaerae bacterium]
MLSFENKWVLITGASKGLGKELAFAFADAGANLILTARSGDLLGGIAESIKKTHGVRCDVIAGDICSADVFDEVCKAAIERDIEVLVNNAGIVSIDLLEDVSVERIEMMVQLNLLVPIKLTRAVIPMFKKRRAGTIVNINSTAGRKAVAEHAVYCATKHGMTGFAEALKMEVKGMGIRVFNVSPGKMATELFTADDKDIDTSAFIPPREVAETAVRILQMCEKCGPTEFAIDRMG